MYVCPTDCLTVCFHAIREERNNRAQEDVMREQLGVRERGREGREEGRESAENVKTLTVFVLCG